MKRIFAEYTIWSKVTCAAMAMLLALSCSDITERQQDYLDKGETIYVGKLDSIVVHGGNNRAVIVGKNTFLRTAKQCLVRWVDLNGNSQDKLFDLKDAITGQYTKLVVSPLAEGDYQFFVQTIDAQGNKSQNVECFGSSYGDLYADMQPKIMATSISVEDDGTTEIALSQSQYATRYDLTYVNNKGVTTTINVDKVSSKVTIPDWCAKNNTTIKITTYVMPEDKLGLDELPLAPNTQTILESQTEYNVDKSKITPMVLTAYQDDGKAYGAVGLTGLFDNAYSGAGNECWSHDRKVPGHVCFDLGKKTSLSKASVIGRSGFCGWDIVKVEIWGRESLDDGPDGDTGYKILANDDDANFEKEAIKRQWKRVGKGWFTYSKPRKNPQTSEVSLTELDPTFKPRYIMYRIMSVLAPDTPFPVTDDKYYGDDGGYYVGDGVNDSNRTFCIGELGFKAMGTTYRIQ